MSGMPSYLQKDTGGLMYVAGESDRPKPVFMETCFRIIIPVNGTTTGPILFPFHYRRSQLIRLWRINKIRDINHEQKISFYTVIYYLHCLQKNSVSTGTTIGFIVGIVA